MRCSICLSTYNKPYHLSRTLESILKQNPPFEFEIIVVDDGSYQTTWEALQPYLCDITYVRIDRPPGYRGPAIARNLAYRRAEGEVIICQSDDVIHYSENCIERLVNNLHEKHFLIATVYNVDTNSNSYSDPNGKGYGDQLQVYTSSQRKRPLFFLGSLWRKDLYAVGGNDEDFADPSREDVWFGLCLTRGLNLQPVYSSKIVGHHQHHQHCTDYEALKRSRLLFDQKVSKATASGIWQATDGSWRIPSAAVPSTL